MRQGPWGANGMPSYRFSLLAADGNVETMATLRAATDDAAAEIAVELLMKSTSDSVEVWEATRLVFRAGRD